MDRGALRAAAALPRKKAHSFSFDGFGLSKAIIRAVAEGKHGTPRQIQENKRSQSQFRAATHTTPREDHADIRIQV
jgi:hypothetical protein